MLMLQDQHRLPPSGCTTLIKTLIQHCTTFNFNHNKTFDIHTLLIPPSDSSTLTKNCTRQFIRCLEFFKLSRFWKLVCVISQRREEKKIDFPILKILKSWTFSPGVNTCRSCIFCYKKTFFVCKSRRANSVEEKTRVSSICVVVGTKKKSFVVRKKRKEKE